MPFDILYRDQWLVAIQKPTQILVHRTSIARDKTNCLTELKAQIGAWVTPAHRLDRATSGVLLFALDSETASRMGEIFAHKKAVKKYLAVVRGYVAESGRIERALREDEDRDYLDSVTDFQRLGTAEFPKPVGRYQTARYSLVLAEPKTGRMHQIRKHFRSESHPILGDQTYGDSHHNRFMEKDLGVRRMMLHAHELEFPHPHTGETIRIHAPLQEDFKAVLSALQLPCPVH